MNGQSTRQVWTVTYLDPQNIVGSSVMVFLDDDGERAFEFAASHHTTSIREQLVARSSVDRILRIWGRP